MKYFAFQPKFLWQFLSAEVFSEKGKFAMRDG